MSVCDALRALIISLLFVCFVFVCLFVCLLLYIYISKQKIYIFQTMSICMSRKCVPVSGDGPRGPEPMSPCLPAERLSRWAKPAEVPGRGIRQFQFACFCVHFSVQKMLPVSGDGRRGLEPTSLCLPAERLYRWAKSARYPWYETISVYGCSFQSRKCNPVSGDGRRGPEPTSLCLPAERLSRWAKPVVGERALGNL